MRSYLSRELGNLEQAIKLEEQAIALDPLRTDSYLSLGYLLYVAGRYDEARAALRKALDLNPQHAFIRDGGKNHANGLACIGAAIGT